MRGLQTSAAALAILALPAAVSAVVEGRAAVAVPDDRIFDITQDSAPAAETVRALIR